MQISCSCQLWWIANILCEELHQYWQLSCQGTIAILMFWGLLRNSFLKTTVAMAMMSVQEVQSVVVWCRVGAVSWWYDTGGCYNDTISRVLPIFVWLTARAALQPFVAVMQTPVTRDQTISSNTLISLQYTYTVIEIKLKTIFLYDDFSTRYLRAAISQIVRWWLADQSVLI